MPRVIDVSSTSTLQNAAQGALAGVQSAIQTMGALNQLQQQDERIQLTRERRQREQELYQQSIAQGETLSTLMIGEAERLGLPAELASVVGELDPSVAVDYLKPYYERQRLDDKIRMMDARANVATQRATELGIAEYAMVPVDGQAQQDGDQDGVAGEQTAAEPGPGLMALQAAKVLGPDAYAAALEDLDNRIDEAEAQMVAQKTYAMQVERINNQIDMDLTQPDSTVTPQVASMAKRRAMRVALNEDGTLNINRFWSRYYAELDDAGLGPADRAEGISGKDISDYERTVEVYGEDSPVTRGFLADKPKLREALEQERESRRKSREAAAEPEKPTMPKRAADAVNQRDAGSRVRRGTGMFPGQFQIVMDQLVNNTPKLKQRLAVVLRADTDDARKIERVRNAIANVQGITLDEAQPLAEDIVGYWNETGGLD